MSCRVHKSCSSSSFCTTVLIAIKQPFSIAVFDRYSFSSSRSSCFRSFAAMSNFGAAKDSAAQKAEETKGLGQQKAGETQQATKDAAGATQDKAHGAAGAAGDKAAQAKDGAGNALNEAKDAVGNALNQAKDAVTPNQ